MKVDWIRSLFNRAKAERNPLLDARLAKLQEEGFVCGTCGQLHRGFFDIAFDHPEQWPEPFVPKLNSSALESKHFVSEDFCVLDNEHFFIRTVLELPIANLPGERFGFGVWSTLSRSNFELYVKHFDSGFPDVSDEWFSWLSNRIKGYPDTLNLRSSVIPKPNRQRPLVYIEPSDHPLSVAQRNGISIDRVFEIYLHHGHDLS